MDSKGFTLVELAVVSMIIALLSALLLAHLHSTQSLRTLKAVAQELATNIRKAQNMAITTKVTGGSIPCGYGLYFNKNSPTSFILFADADSDPNCANINRLYDGPTEVIREIYFSSNRVEIASTNPDPISLYFLPPDPETSINYPSGTSEATITLETADGNTKLVKINSAGGVEIE